MYHYFIIHSSVDGHWDFLPLLSRLELELSVETNTGDMDLFELWFFPALGAVVGLLSIMVALSSVQSLSHVQIIVTPWTA